MAFSKRLELDINDDYGRPFELYLGVDDSTFWIGGGKQHVFTIGSNEHHELIEHFDKMRLMLGESMFNYQRRKDEKSIGV